ncbi:MAG: carbohydrate ABC transporter permease [Saccharofermentanales bacterium]
MSVIKKGIHIRISRSRRITLSVRSISFYLFMTFFLIFTAMPIIYMVSTAFKPLNELFIYPPRFFVRNPTLKNFIDLVTTLSGTTVPFLRYVFNSLLTSVVTVSITIIISCMAAYSLGKAKPPGHNILFILVIACLMFSTYVTQIPTYMVVNYFGLVNTYWALIIPKLAVAFNLFLVKQFVEQLPDPLLEAARIDGANEWKVFWTIVMPFLTPAWSTLLVFSFVANWNDFFSPLIYISNEAMKTLPLAMQSIAGGVATVNISRAGAAAATTFILTAPTILIFTLAQKKVVQTMAYSGIKA